MDTVKRHLKLVVTILVLADVAIFGTWYAMWSQVPSECRSWFYQTCYYAESGEKDEFGDVKPPQQVDKFTPGLIDMALPAAAAVNVGVIAWLLLQHRKAKKQAG